MADLRATTAPADKPMATSVEPAQSAAEVQRLGRPSMHPNGTGKGPRSPTRTWAGDVKKDWQLYTLLALPLIYFVVFRYLPMAGNVIAFRKFQPGGSIFGAYWVGLTYFDT